jgi:hypothetical protein
MHYVACLLVAGILVLCYCSNGDHTEEEFPVPECPECPAPARLIPSPSISIPLEGTKWKLSGIVDVETGVQRELEPKNCAGCYTLVFDTDHTASGCSLVSVKTVIDLLCLDKYTNNDMGFEPNDVNIFRSAMVSIKSYAVTSKELKLYFTNNYSKIEYLLFKSVEQ